MMRMFTVAVAVLSINASQGRADYYIERGQKIADDFCGPCHATGLDDDSPFDAAPPFRDLHKRYDVEHLSEALAEGLMSGHPAMPVFQFSPPDIDAFLAYLKDLEKP